METPEHERRSIEQYLYSQSGENFEIEHVEKLTSEYVLGTQYDVWDAHTNEGRWWVITNPTNLYSQEQIKSMDVALSFHVGLMMRVMANRPARLAGNENEQLLDVFRRLDRASNSLDRAEEVEDFQAVGMRLREALLSLASTLASLGLTDGTRGAPKSGDFKAWAELAAGVLAAGAGGEQLRGLLKGTSEKTWTYVNWLTHARRATRQDAAVALGATTQTIESFIEGIRRWRLGEPARCPVCGSYRLALEYERKRAWVRLCETCGWSAVAEAPEVHEVTEADKPPQEVTGDCVVLEDFGIYLSPQQAREMLDQLAQRMEASDPHWKNPFAVYEDGRAIDAHRLVFTAHRGDPIAGAELVSSCEDDNCVNPEHAVATPLPAITGWTAGVVDGVSGRADAIELSVGSSDASARQLVIDREIFDRFGLADLSDLLERPIFMSPASEDGSMSVLLGERRRRYGQSSVINARVRPTADRPAPNERQPHG
jgi:hypothetical protein